MYGAGALAVMLPRGPVVSTRGVLWLAACLRLAVDIIGGYHLVGVWGCVVGLVVGMGCSDVDTLPMPVVAGLLAAACVPFEGPQDRYQGFFLLTLPKGILICSVCMASARSASAALLLPLVAPCRAMT